MIGYLLYLISFGFCFVRHLRREIRVSYITIVIFSLLNNLEIPNDLAMTGEIDLNGFITEIGGLNLKILGAIKANIKTIIFPKENIKDYDIFIEKNKEMKELKDITFYPVENINEVIKIIFK